MILYMAIDILFILCIVITLAFFAVSMYFIGQKIHASMRRESFENPGDNAALIFVGTWLSFMAAIVIFTIIKLSFENYPRFPELRRYY